MDADAPALHPQLVAIADLNLDPNNARTHDARNREAIRNSLVAFRQRKPIVVNRRTMRVEAGNGTVEAALEAGATQIVAVFVDDDAETAAAYAIADNRTAELAEWDVEQLAATIGDLPDVEWNELGWSSEELGDLGIVWPALDTTTVAEHERELPGDQVGEPPSSPLTELGDLWVLGPHRLLCGDAFDADARALVLDGRLADLVPTDPPFAIYGSSTGIGADIADDKMIQPFFSQLGFAIVQSVREFGHVYVCCDWRSWASVWTGLTSAKLSPKNCLVWDKGDGGMGSTYQQCHEFVAMFARLPPPTSMAGTARRGQRIVMGRPNILRHNRAAGDERMHNAAKPISMLVELIENSSDTGDLVLDLFNGSGSVIIAGQRSGRTVCAVELDGGWCDVTVRRWQAETGEAAKRYGRDGDELPGLTPLAA